ERAVGKKLRRVTVEGFDYSARPAERFEVPIGERIAEIRRRKAEERARAREKAEKKAQRELEEANRRSTRGGERGRSAGGGPRREDRDRQPAMAGGPDRPRRRNRRGGRRGPSGGS